MLACQQVGADAYRFDSGRGSGCHRRIVTCGRATYTIVLTFANSLLAASELWETWRSDEAASQLAASLSTRILALATAC